MAVALDGNGAARRKEKPMQANDKCLNERHICGQCLWYDQLGDLCRNPAAPHEWENVERGMGCRRWEKEYEH